jgi:predicted SAM-dependent methyltransferase
MNLNLGCSDNHVSGYINVDRCEPADVVADLSQPWPWSDSSIHTILAHDIIEHLPNKIQTMNEAWRVLMPQGVMRIKVPTTDGMGAFSDPTHISFWNRASFWYYEHSNPHRERFGKAYGIEARFKTILERVTFWQTIPTLEIHLEAIK